jgi:hypothetical protein
VKAIAAALALASCAGTKQNLPAQDAGLIAALRSKVPIDPIGIDSDPYEKWKGKQPPAPPAGTVCAVRFEDDGVRYRLATFASEQQARAEGWSVTHTGACGTCSTLQDLAVYLERPDLTTPVRRCGIRRIESWSLSCIEGLGFTDACAKTWQYNVDNTRRDCFRDCVEAWIEGEPSADAQGHLNPCLQCDENRSGPVFKAVAGRTRRNSGIRSSIPRPDAEVSHVVHDYVPAAK